MSELIRKLRSAQESWGAGDERAFRSWYGAWSKRGDIDPNPDAPEHQYDYRAAYLMGHTPDADMHWPSMHKKDGHPNLIIDGLNTKTGVRQ
jgi:hypothetical protein